ncbi:hypothetical protein [Corynebacterium sp. 335C]
MKHRKRRAGYAKRAGLAVVAAALAAVLAPVILPPQEAAANPLDAIGARASSLPAPKLNGAGQLDAPARTEIVAVNLVSGETFTTANPHEQMPGLSIAKLYMAQYIVEHGDAADIPAAEQMIRVSHDGIATQLYRKYPTSIADTARDYGLGDTVAARAWGSSRTSAHDMATFLRVLLERDPAGPVVRAMKATAPVAADGYAQDYGTSRLPGAQGTKFGWSDDRTSAHATATIGDGYVIGASTYGTAQALTDDVLGAFPGGENPANPVPDLPDPFSPPVPDLPLPELPGVPGVPGLPGSDALPELPGSDALPEVPGLPLPDQGSAPALPEDVRDLIPGMPS